MANEALQVDAASADMDSVETLKWLPELEQQRYAALESVRYIVLMELGL